MTAALHISRLATRVRASDRDSAGSMEGLVRGLMAGTLQRAFEAACSLALLRAGLPGDAFVAVRRLRLRLVPKAGIDGDDLASGWARALQEALTQALMSAASARDTEGPDLAWFSDVWEAQERYLSAMSRDAIPWWAGSLPTTGSPGMPPSAYWVLEQWLVSDPARMFCSMASLIHGSAALARLLSQQESAALVGAMLDTLASGGRLGGGVEGGSGPRSMGRDSLAGTGAGAVESDVIQNDGDRIPDEVGGLARQCLAMLPAGLGSVTAQQRGPWILAQLLSSMPSLARLQHPRLLGLVESISATIGGSRSKADVSFDPGRAHWTPGSRSGPVTKTGSAQTTSDPWGLESGEPNQWVGPVSAQTCVGGLLLLIRPLDRLDLVPAGPESGVLLGDLALMALRRVLAPLSTGERGVAQERERSLLGLFAPERDWREPIHAMSLVEPAKAEYILDQLQEQIPRDIVTPGSGALHLVFGTGTPAFETGSQQRLAYLLCRPGRLLIDAWSAELEWPLTAVDLALRRSGWDQDPGWVPWLGRVIRFRFEAGS